MRRGLLLAFLLLVMGACAPLAAQCPSVDLVMTGGERYYVIVGNDTVQTRASRDKADADVVRLTPHHPGVFVRWESPQQMRGVLVCGLPPRDTVRLPGRVDTVYVPVPDSGATVPDSGIVNPPDSTPPDTVVTPPVITPPPDTVGSLALWSPQWRAGWLASTHPWRQLIAGNCAGNRYGDVGGWCAIEYRLTGDTLAGQKAAATWLAVNPVEANANHRREHAIEGAILYDALRPVLTRSQETTWLQRLNRWAEIALAINTAQYVGGTRTNDEDQLLGVTLGMQCLDRVAGTTWSQHPQMVNTLIPAVRHALDAAIGGELAESYAYNSGSSVLVALGLACVPDAYPTGFLVDRARYLPYGITPDLRQKQQWWDEQDPRDFTGRLFKDMTGWLAFAGITNDQQVERLIADVVATYGPVGYLTAEPWWRGFYFWWPGKVTPGSPARGSHVATGRGHLYVRTDSVSVQLTASNRTFEDHEWKWTFNASLYRNGEWVITSPRSYGLWPHARGEGSNGISLSGLGAMASRGMTWADSGNGWWAIAGQTSGPLYDQPYYDPPPAYVRAASRVALYTEVNGWSVIVTRDSVDMSDPQTLPKFTRYRTSPDNHQAWLTVGQGKPWAVWHSPVAATLGSNEASWQTAGGQSVVVRYFGGPVSLATMDTGPAFGTLNAGEAKWLVKATTTAPVLWSVVLVGRGTPPATSVVGDVVTIGGTSLTITSAGVR